MNTVESYDRHAVNQRFLKYKPEVPVRADLRGWWVYVITAILEEDVKRRTQMWSWQHMKKHRCVQLLINFVHHRLSISLFTAHKKLLLVYMYMYNT